MGWRPGQSLPSERKGPTGTVFGAVSGGGEEEKSLDGEDFTTHQGIHYPIDLHLPRESRETW